MLKLFITLLALATPVAAGAQDFPFGSDDQDPTRFPVRIHFDRSHARPGETLMMAVELEVPEGYHVYAPYEQEIATKPTKVIPSADDGISFGEARWPKTHKNIEGALEGLETLEGKLYAAIPVTVSADTAPGTYSITVSITYQVCTDQVCLIPTNGRVITADLEVSTQPWQPAHEEIFTTIDSYPTVPPARTSGRDAVSVAVAEYDEQGFLGLLALGVMGGLVSLLMPCVWPLVPITLMYFVKQGANSRSRSFLLSASYALGIIISFTGIGFLFTLLLGADGARTFAANPWVNIVVGALFLLFALSMFGLFEMRLPGFLTNRLAGGSPRSGFGGAFLLGLLFSVVTFTCTIPIAATILALASSTSHRAPAMVAMLVYATTMAAPFLVLGLFPAALKRFPRGGGWLGTVKTTVAFTELGLALFYWSKSDNIWGLGVMSRSVMLGIWVVLLGITTMYLFGLFRKDRSIRVGLARLGWGLAFTVAALGMASGFAGSNLGLANVLLPPEPRADAYASLPEAMQVAREEGKLVFLDFTGVTCTNCAAMKGSVLASDEVKAELKKFVSAELFTDRARPGDVENARLLVEEFGGQALPLYVILRPDGTEVARLKGVASRDAFVEFLRSAQTELVSGPTF